jgi:hypothetical protein
MRYELNYYEWRVIKPMLPHRPRGVSRVDDRRDLNGIFRVLRSGAPWRDLPKSLGPPTTCYKHFLRLRRAGIRAGSWPGDCSRCGRALLSRPKKSRLWPSKRKELSVGKLQLVDGNCRRTVRLLP